MVEDGDNDSSQAAVGDADADRAIRLVVAEGILSTEEARALSGESARSGQGLLEQLRKDGRISGSTFAFLRRSMVQQTQGAPENQPTMRRSGASPDGADQGPDQGQTWEAIPTADTGPRGHADSEAFPVPGWDRYEPIGPLGKGGMGRVFLARDLRLRREVALKFVRGDDPDLARRVVAEARAQARVNDARVCKVYEVGEVRGRVYIAMQHIDGWPLSELIGELTFEERAIVMRGAALGVAAAHEAGLIHRDLKPANIMVERRPDGELRPFVVDFGLARDRATTATVTGTVLGTPHYMSPEQARGEVKQLDRRTDVYSLGATLYTLLVGRGPFEGESPLEVLTRVISDEPPRPRALDPDVPADLEAIAMKCLEKERGARYDSARALAADLDRFLRGEPVVARAAGLGYRLRKRLRRHRRLVAGVAVAAVLVALALGFGLRERWQAQRRAELARRFTERVERIEAEALASALAPAHDLRPDRDRLRRAMGALADEVRGGGALAAGPGRYALGRGYLALDDDDAAAAELGAAWESGAREPRVAYHLALAQGHLYQRALGEIARVDLSKEQRAQRRREIEVRHRDPALRYLRESAGPGTPSAYVAALIAFYEDRFDDALAQLAALDRGGEGRAWSYEVPLLRGQVLAARAEARAAQGAAVVAADLAAGRGALEAAAAIGRSVPAVRRARAELELTALWFELYGAGAVAAPFERGVAAVGEDLALLPDDAGALLLRARLRRGLAEHRGRRGEDATALLREAVADAERAVALDPELARGRLVLASVYKQWGEFRQNRSEDPGEQLGRAASILDAIPAPARDAELHVILGLVHTVWANYQDRAGRDSAAHRRQAIAAFEQAGQLDASRTDVWLNLGDNYVRRAERGADADASADFARAREALARARAIDPSQIFRYEGDLYARIARYEQRHGRDPAADRARAIESYQQGTKESPRAPYLYNAISDAYLEQAQEARAHARDPRPDLDQAEAAAQRAVDVAPENGFGHINLGAALLERAEDLRGRGADPLPAAHRAEAAFARARELLPRRPSIWWSLADLHILVAGVELDQGHEPAARAHLAQEALDRAVELDPGRAAEARGPRVQIQELRARWQARAFAGASAAPAK